MSSPLERIEASRKTVTRTTRIDEDVNRLLEEFASKERLSVNLLINRSLRKFVEWDSYAHKFGFCTLPSSLLERIIENVKEENVRELGKWAGRNLVKEYALFWFKDISLQNLLAALRMMGSVYGGLFQYEYVREGPRHTLVLKHGMGRRWSTFWEEAVKTAFQDLLEIELHVESTENQVVGEFQVT